MQSEFIAEAEYSAKSLQPAISCKIALRIEHRAQLTCSLFTSCEDLKCKKMFQFDDVMIIWEKSHKGKKFKEVTSNPLFRSSTTERTHCHASPSALLQLSCLTCSFKKQNLKKLNAQVYSKLFFI